MLKHALQIQDLIIAWRRDFHQHPELGFRELRTAARIAGELRKLGYRVTENVGRTGVVAEFGSGKPVIGIRADMDALPIQEIDELDYASKIAGVMHACGHDGHMAVVLGVAHLLSQHQFPGTVRFLFQPSEEYADEESVGGAIAMIKDGAMAGVETILGLHMDPNTDTGKISLVSGPALAGVDTFYATIFGEGGHGAFPHHTIDPIHLAGHVILALNAIVSRRVDPLASAVVSLGSIHAGSVSNVIPDRVEICGTIRFMSEAVQKQMHAEIRQALEVARVLGGSYDLRIEIGYPPMINDPAVVAQIAAAARYLIGEENVVVGDPAMGSEDFGLLSTLAPGAQLWLGCRIDGDQRYLHNPRFNLDERSLAIGTAVIAETVLRLLKQP